MNGFLAEVTEEFQRRIIDEGKLGAFVVLTAFLLTFAAVRGLAHAVRCKFRFARNIRIAGVHVHHMVPGIGLILLTGYLAFRVRLWRPSADRRTVRGWSRSHHG